MMVLFPTLVSVFSSYFEHNCLWLTNQDTFAYVIGVLYALARNTWLVLPD